MALDSKTRSSKDQKVVPMRQKIAIITGAARWGSYLRAQLMRFFPNEVEIDEYNADENPLREPADADLLLIAAPIVYHSVRGYFSPSTPAVHLSTTLTMHQYKMVREIRAGAQVLVVNDSESAVISTISELYELGLTHLKYYPYTTTPVTSEVRPSIAITPGESWLVPDYVDEIVDIGSRVIDLPCLTEIAIYLGLEHLLKGDIFSKYSSELCVKKNSLSYLLDRSRAVSEVFLSLTSTLGAGLVIVDRMGLIQDCNDIAAGIIGNRKNVIGKQIGQLLPCQPTRELEHITHNSDTQLISFNNTAVSVRVIPIKMHDVSCGALVSINSFEENERRQQNLRRQIQKKGHVAKWNFDDIITVNSDMLALKIAAEKHAKSNATVLITGESGTGKEVLAQAIHNASDRKDCPFVSLNCATLPNELLESALFGYEEGVFTGVRKGGKIGLLELAATGTVFLDEIGDMDLELQARILRVLEDRDILRIGGDTAYPVDIRVIAATNQDLWDLMGKGQFRQDLYYRLNVIPLEPIPLRQRTDDILLLFRHFAKLKDRTYTLSPEAEAYLVAYPWYGNIRELLNWVEYLSLLDLDHLELKDMQRLLHVRQKREQPGPHSADEQVEAPAPTLVQKVELNPEQELTLQRFYVEIAGGELHYYLVMQTLIRGHGQGVGRHTIFTDVRREGYQLSEIEIRRIVQMLCRHQLALQGSGRTGARITPLGMAAFEEMRGNPCLKNMLNFLDN